MKKILIIYDAPVDLLEAMREAVVKIRDMEFKPIDALILNRAETKIARKVGYKGKIITTRPFKGRFIASRHRGRK